MNNVPVYQVLEILSQQASFTVKIRPNLVLIQPMPKP